MNNKYDQISGKIEEHIRLTLEYVSGITQDSFENNRMLQDACIFNVLQVGKLAAGGDHERSHCVSGLALAGDLFYVFCICK